jgi:uncharacterized protein (TIGR02246 family)
MSYLSRYALSAEKAAALAVALTIIAGPGLHAAPAAAAPQFSPFEAAIAGFDAEVARGVADDGAGCVSIAVFIGDEVVWENGYGWADMERRIACTPETIGRTGSISKSFTAVMMMQLIERGIFDLDDPVVDYFPEIAALADPPAAIEEVTFRRLASHTAGLIREPELEGAAAGSIYQWEDKILESIPNTSFKTPPGTEYSYSNIGFGMLGLASSRAAGVPFMELVTEQIFRPLGMTSSTFIINEPELSERLSVGYTRSREDGRVSAELATREHFGRGYKVPNGGIYSTVADLAKFAAAMMGASSVQILSEESRAEMMRPQSPADGYGLGFTVFRVDGMKIVGHGGSVAGYNAGLQFELGSGVGVATLRTSSYVPPATRFLRELVGAVATGLSDEDRVAEGKGWVERLRVRREITRLNRGMEQAFRDADPAAVAAFYAEDAVMIGPGTRVEGSGAILEYWKRISDPINWTLEVREVTGTGEIVHQTGRSHLTYLDGLEERTSIVDFVLVWRRQEDGSYKIAIDSYHDPQR